SRSRCSPTGARSSRTPPTRPSPAACTPATSACDGARPTPWRPAAVLFGAGSDAGPRNHPHSGPSATRAGVARQGYTMRRPLADYGRHGGRPLRGAAATARLTPCPDGSMIRRRRPGGRTGRFAGAKRGQCAARRADNVPARSADNPPAPSAVAAIRASPAARGGGREAHMPVYRIEVSARQRPTAWDRQVAATLREADLPVADVCCSRLFLVEGDLDRATVEDVTRRLLVDPVTETGSVLAAPEAPPDEPGALEVHLLPGVMDPTGLTTLEELRQEGLAVSSVRTAQRYRIAGDVDLAKAGRALANDCIERVVIGAAPIEPAPRPPVVPFELRHVPLRELDDAELARLSRDGHLFLSLEEMRRIQAHYR